MLVRCGRFDIVPAMKEGMRRARFVVLLSSRECWLDVRILAVESIIITFVLLNNESIMITYLLLLNNCSSNYIRSHVQIFCLVTRESPTGEALLSKLGNTHASSCIQ